MAKMYIDKAFINQCKGKCKLVKITGGVYQLVKEGETIESTSDGFTEYKVNGKNHICPSIGGSMTLLGDDTTLCLNNALERTLKLVLQSQFKLINPGAKLKNGVPTAMTKAPYESLNDSNPEIKEIIKGCISYEAFLDAVLGFDWVYPVNKVMDPV